MLPESDFFFQMLAGGTGEGWVIEEDSDVINMQIDFILFGGWREG